jgi:hypothetical protein
MDLFEPLECGQRLDRFATGLFGEADFIYALQIQLKFGGRAKEMREAQGRPARAGGLALPWHSCRSAPPAATARARNPPRRPGFSVRLHSNDAGSPEVAPDVQRLETRCLA